MVKRERRKQQMEPLTKSCREEEEKARCGGRSQIQVGSQEIELEDKDDPGLTAGMGCFSEKIHQCRQLKAAGSSCTWGGTIELGAQNTDARATVQLSGLERGLSPPGSQDDHTRNAGVAQYSFICFQPSYFVPSEKKKKNRFEENLPKITDVYESFSV